MTDENDNMQQIEALVSGLKPGDFVKPGPDNGGDPSAFALQLSGAMRAVGSIDKDKTNIHGKYDYVSEAAVKRATNKALHAHELAVLSCQVFLLDRYEVKGKSGASTTHMICEAVIVVGNGNGSSTFRAMGQGSGYDDKVLMKAQSTAIRECWKTALCIAQGHDPEDDHQTDVEANGAKEAKPAQPRVEGMQDEQLEQIKSRFVTLNIEAYMQTDYCIGVVGHSGKELTRESASKLLAHMGKQLEQMKDGAS